MHRLCRLPAREVYFLNLSWVVAAKLDLVIYKDYALVFWVKSNLWMRDREIHFMSRYCSWRKPTETISSECVLPSYHYVATGFRGL